MGVVQEIDAAAMSLWLSYRHFDADATYLNGWSRGDPDPWRPATADTQTKVKFDPMQIVKFGALINF